MFGIVLLVVVGFLQQAISRCPSSRYTACSDMCDEGLRDPAVMSVLFSGSVLEGSCIRRNIKFITLTQPTICRNMEELHNDLKIPNKELCSGEPVSVRRGDGLSLPNTAIPTSIPETTISLIQDLVSSEAPVPEINSPITPMVALLSSTVRTLVENSTAFSNLTSAAKEEINRNEKQGISVFSLPISTISPKEDSSSFVREHLSKLEVIPAWIVFTLGALLAVVFMVLLNRAGKILAFFVRKRSSLLTRRVSTDFSILNEAYSLHDSVAELNQGGMPSSVVSPIFPTSENGPSADGTTANPSANQLTTTVASATGVNEMTTISL